MRNILNIRKKRRKDAKEGIIEGEEDQEVETDMTKEDVDTVVDLDPDLYLQRFVE
mgnify:CR=1 FL=1